ncbi:MAG: DUF1801 domain-containing protein [Caulobacter sp.]|nr:DUF1801 domain-containing protein [Caulobacter sp.]
MSAQDEIETYLVGQPEPKQGDLRALDALIRRLMPGCQLRFLDGRNAEGKTVTNPNIGYGSRETRYSDGSIREFYQIGLSGNASGISVYILGLDDKAYLARTFGETLGKAKVTGYCIRFKALKDVDLDVLAAAIRSGIEQR